MDTLFPIWNDCGVFEFTDLRVFARIAALGSVSGAARALAMPKSSVSRSLARLEKTVAATLIDRSTHHVRLTDAGRVMQQHAQRILDDVIDAEGALGGLAGVPRGTLRVSVPFTFAMGPLAPMMPAFMARYPEVRVVLTIDNRIIDLLAEDYDVAIRIGPLRDSDLIARRLASFSLWTCASPAYLASRGTPRSVPDLKNHTLISRIDKKSIWRFRGARGIWRQFEVIPGTVVPEPAVLKTILIGGGGIGRLPDFDASDAIADGRLVNVLPNLGSDSVAAHALYPGHRSLSAKVRVFIDALVHHLSLHGAQTKT